MTKMDVYVVVLTLVICFSPHAAEALSLARWPPWDCGYTCDIACPCGRNTDVRGCPECSCRKCDDMMCPRIKCSPDTNCPNGFLTFLGCPTCICKPGRVCPDLSDCHIKCAYGQKIVDGCRTCNCNQCPVLHCKRFCPNGHVTINGCRTCQCKPIVIDPLPTVRPCGTKSICPMYVHCPWGYKIDADGCRTCECELTPTS